ncbi:RPA-interacting protein-like isoform X1 [Haliotis rubra]|uniref:RPA-interacting protein-like isoform X1 n=1 Tax=Haliotis rubra TaxID=36100 RepID=UPI001EE4FA66|nr:RPA-interacting protein-like isoform X1 [Haliotis rubra]XP_046578311.1 RPA-interacting protein-like isoform X1 [Haliotis rubra]XP_046578312.1 RPA-interacting protein-like isoform X1 [Haliotis rubra]
MASSPRSLKRREMYKIRTPPWKEAYRKRCLDRLRGSREKLFSRFRNIQPDSEGKNKKDEFIKDLMTDEWKSLQRDKASGNSADLMDFDMASFDVSEVDEMLNLFEDIQDDLIKEESKLLSEYERYELSLQREEEVLCSAIETLSTEDVLCPVCQKHVLMLNKGIVFCSCGLRIDTEQDCLSLSNISQQLTEGMSEHTAKCPDNPSFQVMSGLGATNLLMTCQTCDFMSVVI